ncbi:MULTISPECIES: hypothetical protein [unclassified Streptomyces]|uniref:hypothetical protein n=1 Tax=unclassified Streptomyces TaxID=2593676 RepID=UPI001BEAA7CE|nr:MULTISPECIES: hypothetical protein [unclassified Streptomyces]MBT2404134.1 hypothetical protein [Streptomyces sp. ISL-21]MBT2458973.1 hypothetical protein [Streptomyces sp. ISL-86]MBT2607150.1 hypothetical protein [Streptomyces sp. ISL-87]
MPPSPPPGPTSTARRAGEVAAWISAITGIFGLLLGFYGLPAVVNSPTAGNAAPTATVTATVQVTATVTAPAAAPPPADGAPSPSGGAPTTGGGQSRINLPMNHVLDLMSDPVAVAPAEGSGHRGISYDYSTSLYPRSAKIILLDSGQQGAEAVCKAETRYSNYLKSSDVVQGSQICVITDKGVVGLLTVRALPGAAGSVSNFYAFDVTVWRGV